MSSFKLTTRINAPITHCFDLSRDIDLHLKSMSQNKESVIAGVKSGLIGENETVTWRAKHFGIRWTLSTHITAYKFPEYFTDEKINGPFKSMKHQHHFQAVGNGTLMTDIFEFESPLGIIGKIIDRLFLKNYMQNLIVRRNKMIKKIAEINNVSNENR